MLTDFDLKVTALALQPTHSIHSPQSITAYETKTDSLGAYAPNPNMAGSRRLAHAALSLLLMAAVLSTQSCQLKADARVTAVYGKITDQNGFPIDSVTVIMFGGKGLSRGGAIGEANTDSEGKYELVVDVPKTYSRVDATLHFKYQSLLDRYYENLVFQDGKQKDSCCKLLLGGKRNYDFVLLPK